MSNTRENRTSSRLPNPDFVHPELVAPETGPGRSRGTRWRPHGSAWAGSSSGPSWTRCSGWARDRTRRDPWIAAAAPPRASWPSAAAGPVHGPLPLDRRGRLADWLFMARPAGHRRRAAARRHHAPGRRERRADAGPDVDRGPPPANNPFMDDHLDLRELLVILAAPEGHHPRLGAAWGRLPFVRRERMAEVAASPTESGARVDGPGPSRAAL